MAQRYHWTEFVRIEINMGGFEGMELFFEQNVDDAP